MSWQATAWADGLEYNVVGPLAYRVLIKLANVANERGQTAWRSKSEMATELGVSQRSIQRALKELEHSALILVGDQSFVKHLRADRRPTVYDMNLRFKTEFEQPELSAWNGETELSTSEPRGDTPGLNGETTVVAHRTILELSNSSIKTSHSTSVEQSEELRIHQLVHQPCPLRPGKEHDFTPSSVCTGCGLSMSQRWHKGDIAYLSDLLEALEVKS